MDEDEIKKLDAEQIAAREAEELQKERREMQQKLKSQDKKVDYLERAKRIEEIPLLEKATEEKIDLAVTRWQQQEAERIVIAKDERRDAVATSERMSRLKEEANEFADKILGERKNVYLEKKRDFDKMLDEERAKRLLERRLQRREERRETWKRKRAEAAERARQEEIRIRLEEERVRLEEEMAKKEEEEAARRTEEQAREAERLAKLKKQAEIARAREEEIEKKQEEQRLKEQAAADSWRASRSAFGRDRNERSERADRDNRDIREGRDNRDRETIKPTGNFGRSNFFLTFNFSTPSLSGEKENIVPKILKKKTSESQNLNWRIQYGGPEIFKMLGSE